MRITRIQFILLGALALSGNFSTPAQNNVPGDADYTRFSSFIADRNIFDPNRYPRNSSSTQTRTRTRTRTKSAGTPAITLVGTMQYEKGLFAFFNANDSDNKKIIGPGGEIAGYTVKDISATAVTLVGDDKKEFAMKMGDQMHQDGNAWRLADDASSSNRSPATSEESAPVSEGDHPAAATEPAPEAASSANLEGNDILKKLMEKRAKENQ